MIQRTWLCHWLLKHIVKIFSFLFMYIVRLRHLHCIMKFPKHDQFHVDVSCLCCSNDFTSSIPTSLNIREGEPYFCGCKTLINKLINYHFMTSMHSSSTSDSRVGEIRCSQFVSNAWSVKVVHVVTMHTCSDCILTKLWRNSMRDTLKKIIAISLVCQ